MRVLLKMSWLEMKLFLREPLTVLFAFALPLTILYVMGGVFGNQSEEGFYRGVGSMDYYVPAYIALIAASVGLITLPTHLASNRESGVLRRYRASGFSVLTVLGAQVVVTFVVAGISSMLLVGVALPVHDVVAPDSLLLVILGFTLAVATFSAIGILLGSVMPTSRAAQALGVLTWFVMLMIGGAGPPPEVLTGVMGSIGEWTPLRFTIEIMQEGWLGLDAGNSWLWATAITIVAGGLSIRFLKWD